MIRSRLACDLAQLALHLVDGFARDRALLAAEPAAGRETGELLAARDQRGVQRRWPRERVPPPRLKARVELGERDQDRAHLGDRVDAEVGPRPVRGHARGLELEADEAAMGDRDAQLGRLGHDRRVRANPLEHRLGARRGELLVSDDGDDHIAAQPGRLRGGEQDRRKRALHVVGAAPIQPAVLDARLERRLHPCDANRVQMSVQQQRAAAARAAPCRDHARRSRSSMPFLRMIRA